MTSVVSYYDRVLGKHLVVINEGAGEGRVLGEHDDSASAAEHRDRVRAEFRNIPSRNSAPVKPMLTKRSQKRRHIAEIWDSRDHNCPHGGEVSGGRYIARCTAHRENGRYPTKTAATRAITRMSWCHGCEGGLPPVTEDNTMATTKAPKKTTAKKAKKPAAKRKAPAAKKAVTKKSVKKAPKTKTVGPSETKARNRFPGAIKGLLKALKSGKVEFTGPRSCKVTHKAIPDGSFSGSTKQATAVLAAAALVSDMELADIRKAANLIPITRPRGVTEIEFALLQKLSL